MATIREIFHEIGNWHNKITMCAGVTKEMLKREYKDRPLPQEAKDALIKKLSELEQYAVGADKVLLQLKGIIYKKVNPDLGQVKNKGGAKCLKRR